MRLSTTRAAWCAALLLVVATVAGVARGDCTKDIECKGERICERGRCVMPPAAAPSTTPTVPAPATTPASTATPASGGPSTLSPLPLPPPQLPRLEPSPKPPPPPQDESAKVEVTFTPEAGQDDDGVELHDDDGRTFTCRAPCTLRLVPAEYHLQVEGSTSILQDIEVPDGGARVKLRGWHPGNYTLMEVGAGVSLLGWIAGLTGFVWDNVNPSNADPTAPITVFIAGSVAAIGGTILIFAAGPRGAYKAEVSPRKPRPRGKEAARPPAIRFVGVGMQETAEHVRVPALTFQFR